MGVKERGEERKGEKNGRKWEASEKVKNNKGWKGRIWRKWEMWEKEANVI